MSEARQAAMAQLNEQIQQASFAQAQANPLAKQGQAAQAQLIPGAQAAQAQAKAQQQAQAAQIKAAQQAIAAQQQSQIRALAIANQQAQKIRYQTQQQIALAKTGLSLLGDKVSNQVIKFPIPGGIGVPLTILLILFVILIKVNGHSRSGWFWYTLLGDAEIDPTQAVGVSFTPSETVNSASAGGVVGSGGSTLPTPSSGAGGTGTGLTGTIGSQPLPTSSGPTFSPLSNYAELMQGGGA